MIRSLVLAVGLLVGPASRADDGAAPAAQPSADPAPADAPADDDDALTRYRTPFDVLADRAIGTTSAPVEFNWRHSPIEFAGGGSFLLELNNFNSARVGGLLRIPSGGVLLELGVAYAHPWNTPSSRLLALTPYRQPGRPDRMEIDFTLGVPVAEGVVTVAPRFFPAVELVFNLYGGLRYLLYPTGFAHMTAGQVATSVIAPALSETEIDNLDEARLASMEVDPGRYALMLGFGDDLYFKEGIFLSPRAMFAVPVLALATETNLLFTADISVSLGIAL